jgi:two-component system OmpR family response regulator
MPVVLVVEDEPSIQELISVGLTRNGHAVRRASNAEEAMRQVHEALPDVILLDWMLPDGDGPSFCESARLASILTPILMLTARGEVHDRVSGLRSGADDYLVKPFEVEELLARLDALVRRSAQIARLVIGNLVIDRVQRHCTVRGVILDLTVREYELLVRLAAANGAPVSRAILLRDVWRMAFDPGSGVLDVQISRLRDKLGEDSSRIETVRGVGYRLRTDP